MVAKVIRLDGNIFYVKDGEDIHQPPLYDGLPLHDKKYLACESIKGCNGGFALTSDDFHEPIVVSRDCDYPLPPLPCVGAKWDIHDSTPILVLPEGTRIKPLTDQQMEDEIRVQQRPSLREK
jgi:hypothetical protein